MEVYSKVETPLGEFRIKNILSVGEENGIEAAKAVLSDGMYDNMMLSKLPKQRNAATNIFCVAELNGRIVKAPDKITDVNDLSKKEFDELWEAWTKTSGMFLDPENVEPAGGKKDDEDDSSVSKVEGEVGNTE